MPRRGELWWAALDPTPGSEISKTRPYLVMTTNVVNEHRRTLGSKGASMAVAKTGAKAPAFILPDLKGSNHSLEELLQGGPVLLAFFKISCPTCQYTFPFLDRLHKKLNGASARVIGISQDVKRKTEQFNKDYGVSFPVLLDSEDENYLVSNTFGITHVPSLFLIDPDGRIVLSGAGFVRADLEEIARRLGPIELFHRDEKIESFRAG